MASTAAPSDNGIHLSLSKTRRDFRVSLALVVAGIVLEAVSIGLQPWMTSYRASELILWTLLTVGSAGSVLIFVGAIFAGVNWSLIRKANKPA